MKFKFNVKQKIVNKKTKKSEVHAVSANELTKKKKTFNNLLIIGICFLVVSLFLNVLEENIEVITNYFKESNVITFTILLFAISFLSIVKTLAAQNNLLSNYPKYLRYLQEGYIILTTVVIFCIMILYQLLLNFQWEWLISLGRNIIILEDKFILVEVLGLFFSIYVVACLYSLIDTMYLLYRTGVERFSKDVTDIEARYTIGISSIAIVISLIALFT